METNLRISFTVDGGETFSVPAIPGESLLETARRGGVAIDAPCSGNGSCGKCRVRVLSGEAEGEVSWHISPADHELGWRLACGVKPLGDLEVFVPSSAGAFRDGIKVSNLGEGREKAFFDETREAMTALGYAGDSGIERVSLNLERPSLDDPMADRERLLAGLEKATGRAGDISLFALRKLPRLLREADFSLTCVIRREEPGDLVLDILPGGAEEAPLPALAIDVGTTTVAMALTDLRTGDILASLSAGNGQIRFGADVINRIIESARPGGLERLRRAVLDECLIPLVEGISGAAGIKPEGIYRAVFAANTTMTHLFAGVYADNLRLEPYVPAFYQMENYRAAELGLPIHPSAELIIAPCIGSYVGGDITAGVLSSRIFQKENFSLFVDLGTNGELVFGNGEVLMSCACSAGPAFEGGDISCGMRATDGAVEACSIHEETLEPRLDIIGGPEQKPLGLCGSGLIDTIGELFRCGAINARGKFIRDGGRIRRDDWGAGYILAFAGESGTGGDICLTETDIDSFIRAKGAVFSAIKTMLTAMDFPAEAIDGVSIAGGIGGGINMEKAVRIGMFPKLPPEKYRYIGNTSLLGAWAMANSRSACAKVKELARGMTYLELSSHPGYMDEFVAACFLPHTNEALFK